MVLQDHTASPRGKRLCDALPKPLTAGKGVRGHGDILADFMRLAKHPDARKSTGNAEGDQRHRMGMDDPPHLGRRTVDGLVKWKFAGGAMTPLHHPIGPDADDVLPEVVVMRWR
jgi:hypothetical protein